MVGLNAPTVEPTIESGVDDSFKATINLERIGAFFEGWERLMFAYAQLCGSDGGIPAAVTVMAIDLTANAVSGMGASFPRNGFSDFLSTPIKYRS
jgi:hypothetical protein